MDLFLNTAEKLKRFFFSRNKTKFRNLMSDESLDHLMNISVNRCENETIYEACFFIAIKEVIILKTTYF